MNRTFKIFLYVATASFSTLIFANVDDLDVRSGKAKSKADHSYKIAEDTKAKANTKSDKKRTKSK